MNILLRAWTAFICSCMITTVSAQGYFSGSFQLESNFFVPSEAVGTAGLEHYDNLKSGADAWFDLNYNNSDLGLSAGVRFDMYANSILHNPLQTYTRVGLGRFYISKTIKDVKVTAGHFYDQIGSGILFRSYEERPLGIDNPLLGVRVEYPLKENIRLKAFGGLQKNRFELRQAFVKGATIDGDFLLNDKVTLVPGFGVVNRTIDNNSMDEIVAVIESQDETTRFVPKFNTYAFTAFNTLSYKNLTWYLEGSYKTNEAVNDIILKDRAGTVIYTTLTYSKKGLGITGQFKRTDNFAMQISPLDQNLVGIMNFIPSTNRQNSLRLPARYNAATQVIEELSGSVDVTWTPSKKVSFNFSNAINSNHFMKDDSVDLYFNELYIDALIKFSRKSKMTLGYQYIRYNQFLYEGKGPKGLNAFTPFMEYTYKFSRKKSLRIEAQYQHDKDNFGQWAYALVEFNIAPKWSFSVSDMWNFDYNPKMFNDDLHYYSANVAFNHKSSRFNLGYVRQVEGIVCTGGVCRFEPAFNGAKLSINTTF